MERLTKREGKHTIRIGNEWRRHDLVWDKLAEYEDVYEQTGLTLEEAVDVIHRYRTICKWLTLYDIQHIEETAAIIQAFHEGKLLYNY